MVNICMDILTYCEPIRSNVIAQNIAEYIVFKKLYALAAIFKLRKKRMYIFTGSIDYIVI